MINTSVMHWHLILWLIIYNGRGFFKVTTNPSCNMASITHFTVAVGELTNLTLAFILLMTWMAGFGKVSIGANGPTLHYRFHRAVVPPPIANPSIPSSYDYEAGDLWTCGDSHWFWDGAEWIRWTSGEQCHPNNESVVLYQRRNGSVKWKVITV
jgi:hypothetical protein